MKIIGIGGGTGSGKTTVCKTLAASDPNRFTILTLDNYQKAVDDPSLPRVEGMINWDDPSVILWDNLRRDVAALRNGEEVHTHIWTHRSVAGIKEPAVLVPRNVIIVEGYLALHAEMVGVYDKAIYFELDKDIRYARRRQARGSDDTESVEDTYHTKILEPMHEQHVEPTKAAADTIIYVANKSVTEVAALVLNLL